MSKRCVLVGGGEFCREKFKVEEGVPIVAVDGGYEYVKGLALDCVIGDFDSLGYFPEGETLVKHDPVKDYTDMYLAVQYMAEKGFDEVEIFGGLGGRIDHTIANLQMAYGFAKKGLRIRLTGVTEEAEIITDELYAQGKAGRIFSLFAFGECKGVTIEGAKYRLDGATLSDTFPLGISNEFTDERCRIAVKEGALIFIRMG